MIKRLSAWLALSIVMSSNVFCYPSSLQDGVDVVSLSHTDETDAAIAFCREGLAPIPLPLQKRVADAGIKVVVTPRTVFDAPEQSGSQVFTNGGTTDNAGGGRGELFASMICAICTKPPLARDSNLMNFFPSVRDYLLSIEPDLNNVVTSSPPIVNSIAKIAARITPCTVAAAAAAAAGANAAPAANPDVDKAFNLIQQHQFGDALRILNGAIKTNPSDARAHLLRGNYLSWLGQTMDQQRDEKTAKRIGEGQPM